MNTKTPSEAGLHHPATSPHAFIGFERHSLPSLNPKSENIEGGRHLEPKRASRNRSTTEILASTSTSLRISQDGRWGEQTTSMCLLVYAARGELNKTRSSSPPSQPCTGPPQHRHILPSHQPADSGARHLRFGAPEATRQQFPGCPGASRRSPAAQQHRKGSVVAVS